MRYLSYTHRRSLVQNAEELLGNTLPHRNPPSEVKRISNEKPLEVVPDNIHDLGLTLQCNSRTQLDLIRIPPPEEESKLPNTHTHSLFRPRWPKTGGQLFPGWAASSQIYVIHPG
jgi:hypothetical protein